MQGLQLVALEETALEETRQEQLRQPCDCYPCVTNMLPLPGCCFCIIVIIVTIIVIAVIVIDILHFVFLSVARVILRHGCRHVSEAWLQLLRYCAV